MRQQVGSVVIALALSSGLLLALLYGPSQPAASSGRAPRAGEAVIAGLAAVAVPAAAERPGGRLLVLDVSAPTRATIVGQSGSLSTIVRGLTVDGPYVYLLDVARGVRMLDASDPAHPTEVGIWDPEFTVRALAASRGQLYAADYADESDDRSGDRVAVRAEPAQAHVRPAPTSAPALPGNRQGVSMAVAGDYAYVAQASGLRILDVRDPAQPVAVGSYRTPDNALAVAVEGRYAYVAAYAKGLRLVDIADPTRPVEVGAYSTPGIAMDVAVHGRYAYVADHASGLHVVDVSDPTVPRAVHTLGPPYYTNSVAVAEGYAFVADGPCGLRVLDLREPARAAEVAHYPEFGIATAVAVAGRYAYLAVTRSDERRPCIVLGPASAK